MWCLDSTSHSLHHTMAVELLRLACNPILLTILPYGTRAHALFHPSCQELHDGPSHCWHWSFPLLGCRLCLSQELCMVLPLISKHCRGWLQLRVLQLQHHSQLVIPAQGDCTSCAGRAGLPTSKGHPTLCSLIIMQAKAKR